MARPSTDPLDGIDRLLVDGSNLLHALRRAAGAEGEGPGPAAAVIGRLRGAIPASVGIELVLDGPPDSGLHGARVASGLIVRYSGRRSGDQVLLGLVEDVRRDAPAGAGAGSRRAAVDNLLVVTDDRDLRLALRERGVRTAGTDWLARRLERRRLEAPVVGNRRGPGRGADADADADPDGSSERQAWRPGRGATAKRGNPKRGRPPRRRPNGG